MRLGCISLAPVVVAAAILLARPCPSFGSSDVFICTLGACDNSGPGYVNWGASGGIRAFSIDTFACNQGDTPANWKNSTNQHPVIAQNMFRLRNGRFEQIGQSWVKHTFFAETDNGCTTCTPPTPDDGTLLGVGCCDCYSAFLNGYQQILGPKSEINASTGLFPYPFCPSCPNPAAIIGRRLQVAETDLDTDPSVLYFMEGQYVVPDDCAAAPRTDGNNSSFRQITIDGSKDLSTWIGGTTFAVSTMNAWLNNDAGVNLNSASVASDGTYYVAAKVTDLGGGVRHYEYAVQNLNSDRAGGSFTVPVAPGVNVSNIGFHGVRYHSGEPYDNTDWDLPANGTSTGSLTWSSHPFPGNPSIANALRWGTTYNFRFDANIASTTASVSLALFKAGSPTSVSINTITPMLCNCPGDMNGDGKIDGADIPLFVRSYLGSNLNYCSDLTAPGGTDNSDLAAFVTLLLNGASCP